MKKSLKICSYLFSVISLISVVFLSGCTTDNTPKPTLLSKSAPTLMQVKTIWSRSVTDGNDGQNLTLGSVLQGTRLITVGYNGDVVALNVANGKTLWQTDLKTAISSTPGSNTDTVFVGTKNGYLYALNLATGQIKWQSALPSLILGSPAATDDVVTVLCHDSSVVALSSATGARLWSYQASLPSLSLYSNSSPFINNGMVYVGFDNGQLGAFDLYRGTEIWQIPIAIQASAEAIKNMVDVDGTPVLDNNTLFVTSYHGTLSAVNNTTGTLIWQRAYSSYETPVVQNNQVIAVDETGSINSFDESTGSPLWQQKGLLYRFISEPTVINNTVVVGDYAGYIHFISLNDGEVLARVQVSSGGIKAAPLVYNNEIIVTSNDGKVVVLQPIS